MVYCVAFNCKTQSGQGIGLYEFPKDEKRRKLWTTRVKRKDFVPSQTSRLCAKHFSNDQFTVNPLIAASIGYKVKKLLLKSDAEPTLFDFSKPTPKNAKKDNAGKKKCGRQSGAVEKRRRIETLSEILEKTDDNKCSSPKQSTSHDEPYEMDLDATESDGQISEVQREESTGGPQRYNAYIQTINLTGKHVACQVESQTATVSTQTTGPCCSSSPEPDDEEVESDENRSDPDWTPLENLCDRANLSDNTIQDQIIPAKERKFIVFERQLMGLLHRECVHCGERSRVVKENVIGTAITFTMGCKCDQTYKWSSQPFSGTMPLGNLIVAGAILFAGCSASKILTFFRHSSIECFSERTFSSIQNAYIVPTVTDVWQSMQVDVINEIQANGNIVKLGGDARCCSPGHTAKYGSYSVMDLETNKVVDVQLVQSNEVTSSNAMELEGLKRCLSYLDGCDVNVDSIVTDRHPSVKKYLREERKDIRHLFDVWHVAKGVYKKIEKIGSRKTKGFSVVARWSRSISNHIYWCAASSQGDEDLIQEKYGSILNHITNIHEGHGAKFERCEHGILENREWIKKDSKPYKEIEKIIKQRMLWKDIRRLSPAEQTSSLESYHRVVCFFAPKSLHFFHAQMEARLYLAALHFNENSARSQAQTADGTPRYRVSYPKSRKGEGVVKEVKTSQTYNYVDHLFEQLLFRREHLDTFTAALANRRQDDKRRPPPLSQTQTTPRRPKEDIIRSHVSRFNRE